LSGGKQPAFDTELFHRPGKSEPVHQDADGANDARAIDVDLIRRHRDVVSARSTNVFDHRIQRNLRILLAQSVDLAIDGTGLHRAAARAIDAQDHAFGALVFEGVLQALADDVRIGMTVGGNDPAEFDQGGMVARQWLASTQPAECYEQQGEEIDESERLEEDAPVARLALFIERRARQFLDYLALPVFVFA